LGNPKPDCEHVNLDRMKMCHCGGVDENARVEELEATIRSLREEVERLKSELSRLRRDRDERPPHYL
jgi:predicted nuclease with TOPRIM domain